MDTSTSALLTGVVVTAGKWSSGDGISVRTVLGAIFLAIILTVMNEANEKFARQFGVLILVGAVFRYAPKIIEKTGLAK